MCKQGCNGKGNYYGDIRQLVLPPPGQIILPGSQGQVVQHLQGSQGGVVQVLQPPPQHAQPHIVQQQQQIQVQHQQQIPSHLNPKLKTHIPGAIR